MKKLGIVIIVIVVLAIVGYGGYKVIHHYTKTVPPAQPTTMTIKTHVSPTSQVVQNTVYKMASNAKLGSYLTDLKGITLYTYAKDTAGVSNCTGKCLTLWPVYVAPSQTSTYPANVSIIKRTDGTLQYAWKGMPLYYFGQDKNPGDTKGQGVGGVWSVAK